VTQPLRGIDERSVGRKEQGVARPSRARARATDLVSGYEY
jgi:hypothetical protein